MCTLYLFFVFPVIDVPTESFDRFTELKLITSKLYSQLNVEEYQLKREKQIIKQLEDYKVEIAPFEEVGLTTKY